MSALFSIFIASCVPLFQSWYRDNSQQKTTRKTRQLAKSLEEDNSQKETARINPEEN